MNQRPINQVDMDKTNGNYQLQQQQPYDNEIQASQPVGEMINGAHDGVEVSEQRVHDCLRYYDQQRQMRADQPLASLLDYVNNRRPCHLAPDNMIASATGDGPTLHQSAPGSKPDEGADFLDMSAHPAIISRDDLMTQEEYNGLSDSEKRYVEIERMKLDKESRDTFNVIK